MLKLLCVVFALFSSFCLAAPDPLRLRLAPKDATALALKQGNLAAEVNLQFLQQRLGPVTALSTYDWHVDLQSGYEYDKTHQFSPLSVAGSTYKRYRTIFGLQKQLTTGTLLGVDYLHLSQAADYSSVASTAGFPTTSLLPQQSQDLFDITVEQSLLANFIGRADRAAVNSADLAFKAAEVARTSDLQTVVLNTLRAFWDGYAAQEAFNVALASRDRYKSLVNQIKHKSGVGYTTPGELSQALAEFESQEQNVKATSTTFLQKLESLTTTLNLPPETRIEFVTDGPVPSVPKLASVNVEELRTIRAQKLRVDSAKENLIASRSRSYPTVNLVGKYYTTGTDDNSGGSLRETVGGGHPKYYAGVHLNYAFGSGLQSEDIANKKVTKELAERQLLRQRLEQNDGLAQAERKVQSTFAIVQSAQRQKEYREKAVRELTRTYNQGRTDIKLLIDAINNQFGTEVGLSRAIGDYQIALNEWSAARDELIPGNAPEPQP